MHQVYGKVSGTQNMCHIFARTGHGQAVQGRRFQYLIVKIVNDLFSGNLSILVTRMT